MGLLYLALTAWALSWLVNALFLGNYTIYKTCKTLKEGDPKGFNNLVTEFILLSLIITFLALCQ